MSKLQVNDIVNKDDDGSVGFSRGTVVTGIATATGVNVTGVVTATTFLGNMTVGGVLTYEDVTNIDSVGIITARSGIEFGASGVGGTITAAGQAEFIGIVTALGVNVSGVVTATSFKGDGSALTGVSAGLASSTVTLQVWLFGGG